MNIRLNSRVGVPLSWYSYKGHPESSGEWLSRSLRCLVTVKENGSHPGTELASYGEAFHANGPRNGNGTAEGTLLAASHSVQIVETKRAFNTDFKIKLTRVRNAQQLARLIPIRGCRGALVRR